MGLGCGVVNWIRAGERNTSSEEGQGVTIDGVLYHGVFFLILYFTLVIVIDLRINHEFHCISHKPGPSVILVRVHLHTFKD